MNFSSRIFISVLLSPVLLFGQKPDFQLASLHSLGTKNPSLSSSVEAPLSASAELYCDGDNLSLVVEVWDDNIKLHNNGQLSDHIEVGFALPRSAYPSNFEYEFHPHYVTAQSVNTRGMKEGKARFFSGYSEYTPELKLQSFLREFDYPTNEQILRDTLRVPPPSLLEEKNIPFGVTRFALFPDSRAAVHLNRPDLAILEEHMGIQLGELAEGVQYEAVKREQGDGYTIHAQFSPEALGFVQLPALSHLRFVVDIFKGRTRTGQALLSTSAYSNPTDPSTFNLVPLLKPLKTNFTPVPSEVFHQLRFYPLGILTREQWLPNQVAVEGLLYREAQISDKLTEVGFLMQPFRYESFMLGETQLKRLTVRHYYLNRPARDEEYFIVEEQVLRHEKLLLDEEEKVGISKDNFLFPDQQPGVITYDITTLNPYGWGDCGDCLDERLAIHRFETDGQSRELLNIRQASGQKPYCQIRELFFQNFYVTQLDWIREGQVLVILLDHTETREMKRIKVEFLDNGNEVGITEIP
jgi:hypothetical protein